MDWNTGNILSGVKIGDGAIIGAGAIVTKDVQPYEIVGGVPACHLKWRFPEHIRKQLFEIKWWDWGDEKPSASAATAILPTTISIMVWLLFSYYSFLFKMSSKYFKL